jgi:phage terminase large subunit-like protein
LTLPRNEWVTITRNAETDYVVRGIIEKTTVEKEHIQSIGDAFYTADQFIRQFGRKLINALRTVPKPSAAAKEPATDSQVRYLTSKLQRMGVEVMPNWAKMTKLEANRLYLRLGQGKS